MVDGWHSSLVLKNVWAQDWKAWDFETFIRNVIEKTPGYLSSSYELYTENPKVDFVGRTENVANDLVRFLRSAGEQFDEDKLRETPMINESVIRAVYPSGLDKEIMRLEKRACEKYGYTHPGDDNRISVPVSGLAKEVSSNEQERTSPNPVLR